MHSLAMAGVRHHLLKADMLQLLTFITTTKGLLHLSNISRHAQKISTLIGERHVWSH